MKLPLFQFFFAILFTNSVFAINPTFCTLDTVQNINCVNQINKKTMSIGIILSHFNPTKKAREKSSQTDIFNLGGEFLFNYSLKSKLGVSSGLYYQFGKIETTFVKERTIFGEISLPIIGNIPLTHSIKDKFTLSIGFYFGRYLQIKREIRGDKRTADNGWHEIPIKYIEGYSSERLISDLYLGLGYREFESNNGFFKFNLFAKYRLNDHWLNQDVSKLIFGLKINHFFKF